MRPPSAVDVTAAHRRQGTSAGDRRPAVPLPTRSAGTREVLEAIRDGRLTVAMQPIVDLRCGAVVGQEALVRWPHPRLGVLGPARFLPLVQAAGAIVELDMLVLRTVCERLAVTPAPVRTSVNVSRSTLTTPGFAERLLAVVERSGLPCAALQIEVSEQVTVADLEVARRDLRQVRAAGVGVLLDDFGAGATSLRHVAELVPYGVKIDRSLVSDLDTREGLRTVIGQIVRLGAELGFRTVAEGVETPAEAAALRRLGCERAQGFLFGRPALAGP